MPPLIENIEMGTGEWSCVDPVSQRVMIPIPQQFSTIHGIGIIIKFEKKTKKELFSD